MLENIRIGLALGGGAARGLAHIGVLQELDRAGIPIHILTGTSIGTPDRSTSSLHASGDM